MNKREMQDVIDYLTKHHDVMMKLGMISLQYHLPFDRIKSKGSYIEYWSCNEKAKQGEIYKEILHIDNNLQVNRIIYEVAYDRAVYPEVVCNQMEVWKMLYETIPHLIKQETKAKYDRKCKKRRLKNGYRTTS